jgi:hypothetical protein
MHPVRNAEREIQQHDFLKAFEVLSVLRISKSTLKRLVKGGKLVRYRVSDSPNSHNLYKSSDVLRLIRPFD